MKRVINNLVMAAIVASGVALWGTSAHADEEQDLRRALDVLMRQDGDGLTIGNRGRLEDLNERLRLRVEIETRLAEIERLKGASRRETNPAQQAPVVQTSPVMAVPPAEGFAVTRISGRDGEYEAIVVDSSGRWISAKTGTELSKGTKVESISFSAVKVREGDKVRSLPMAASSPVSTTVQSPMPGQPLAGMPRFN